MRLVAHDTFKSNGQITDSNNSKHIQRFHGYCLSRCYEYTYIHIYMEMEIHHLYQQENRKRDRVQCTVTKSTVENDDENIDNHDMP